MNTIIVTPEHSTILLNSVYLLLEQENTFFLLYKGMRETEQVKWLTPDGIMKPTLGKFVFIMLCTLTILKIICLKLKNDFLMERQLLLTILSPNEKVWFTLMKLFPSN